MKVVREPSSDRISERRLILSELATGFLLGVVFDDVTCWLDIKFHIITFRTAKVS